MLLGLSSFSPRFYSILIFHSLWKHFNFLFFLVQNFNVCQSWAIFLFCFAKIFLHIFVNRSICFILYFQFKPKTVCHRPISIFQKGFQMSFLRDSHLGCTDFFPWVDHQWIILLCFRLFLVSLLLSKIDLKYLFFRFFVSVDGLIVVFEICENIQT